MEKVQTIKERKPKKGNLRYFLAWSSRGVSLGVNAILLMQITYYATEYVGLSAGIVGTMLLVSKIFDGLTDLAAGFIVDKTNTRWGRARPYELFLIPTWILTIMLFSTPNIGKTGQAFYIFVMYLLINAVCITFLNASEAVFLSRSAKDESLMAKTLSFAGIASMIFPAIVSIILPILMANWGNQPGGWTKIMLVFGVPFTIIGICRFLFVKELPVEGDTEVKITLKESLHALSKNKYIFIISSAALFANLAINVVAAVQTYYFTYIMGDLALMSVVGMLGILTPFILILFPVALQKIGGMNFVKLGLVVAAVGNLIKYFAGTNLTLIMIGSLFSNLGSSLVLLVGSIFVIQCMDYGEWKTGIRVEGMVNSVFGFASKVGVGLASGLVGLVMGLSGYVGGAATQTSSAVSAIVNLYSLIPAIICILMIVVLQFYNLEKMEGQIRTDLEERKNSK